MEKREIYNGVEVDLIKGNINRMCVADNIEELVDMYQWTVTRATNLLKLNMSRLQEK